MGRSQKEDFERRYMVFEEFIDTLVPALITNKFRTEKNQVLRNCR